MSDPVIESQEIKETQEFPSIQNVEGGEEDERGEENEKGSGKEKGRKSKRLSGEQMISIEESYPACEKFQPQGRPLLERVSVRLTLIWNQLENFWTKRNVQVARLCDAL